MTTDPPAVDLPLNPEPPPGEPTPIPEPEPVASDDAESPPEPEPADDAPAASEPADDAPAATEPVETSKKHWYVVKVQSGREETIKEAIERKVKIEGLEEFFGRIVVPIERVTEMRNGKRITRKRKKFPGYIMAEVEYNDKILYLFRDTSGVGDFVGGSLTRAPLPMSDREVASMLRGMEGFDDIAPAPAKMTAAPFSVGDQVRVRDGIFQGMEGEVKEVREPKDAADTFRIKVELTVFGRPTSVELEYWQVDPV